MSSPNDNLTAKDEELIVDALQHLNANYGKGDIQEVEFDTGFVICKLQYGKKAYQFKILNNSVHLHGHQRRFK